MGNTHLVEPAGHLRSCCGPFCPLCTFPNISHWVCVLCLPCWSPSGFPEPPFDWTFPAGLVAQIAVLDQGLSGRRHGYSFTVTAEARVGAMTDYCLGLNRKSLPTSIEIWSAPTEFVQFILWTRRVTQDNLFAQEETEVLTDEDLGRVWQADLRCRLQEQGR